MSAASGYCTSSGHGTMVDLTVFMAIGGQPLVMPLLVVFVIALVVSTALAWVALRTRTNPGQSRSELDRRGRRPTEAV